MTHLSQFVLQLITIEEHNKDFDLHIFFKYQIHIHDNMLYTHGSKHCRKKAKIDLQKNPNEFGNSNLK